MSVGQTNEAKEQIRKLLEGARSVLIVAHVDPDGDAIGSALGLAWALRRRGTLCALACVDPVPESLRFLPGSEAFAPRWRRDEDVIVVVDTGDAQRIGTILPAEGIGNVPLAVIDHHPTNPGYGDVNWVVDRASTCEIVLELVEAMGIPLDATIATCLLTGLITDTRGFRTRATGVAALEAAVTLVKAGAPLGDITEAVFRSRTVKMLYTWGTALVDARLEDGVLWAEVSQDDLRRIGADPSAADGLVSLLSTVREAEVAVVFREVRPGVVDVSLRSTPRVDVAAVALSLGGGGHRQAAGCLLEASLPEARALVLGALRRAMGVEVAVAESETQLGAGQADTCGSTVISTHPRDPR